MDKPVARSSGLKFWIVTVVAATVLPYIPSLGGKFVLDDFQLSC
jgi:hypothetical protein